MSELDLEHGFTDDDLEELMDSFSEAMAKLNQQGE